MISGLCSDYSSASFIRSAFSATVRASIISWILPVAARLLFPQATAVQRFAHTTFPRDVSPTIVSVTPPTIFKAFSQAIFRT